MHTDSIVVSAYRSFRTAERDMWVSSVVLCYFLQEASVLLSGEVSEWLNELVSKTSTA